VQRRRKDLGGDGTTSDYRSPFWPFHDHSLADQLPKAPELHSLSLRGSDGHFVNTTMYEIDKGRSTRLGLRDLATSFEALGRL